MPKYLNSLVVGIDVASEFSFASVLAPDGSQFRKPFKFSHTADGFTYFLEQIKKAEEEFSTKPVFFRESTGVYHLTLFHFLKNKKVETFIINPLVTNCNKNKDIRKVKNDKFVTPKQLVAFFGVDPAVNESGKFKGDRVKMSKRGTRLGRRALYAAALASIRTKHSCLTNYSIAFFYHHSCF